MYTIYAAAPILTNTVEDDLGHTVRRYPSGRFTPVRIALDRHLERQMRWDAGRPFHLKPPEELIGLPRGEQPVGSYYYDLEGKIHGPGRETLAEEEVLPELFARLTLNHGTYANKEGRVRRAATITEIMAVAGIDERSRLITVASDYELRHQRETGVAFTTKFLDRSETPDFAAVVQREHQAGLQAALQDKDLKLHRSMSKERV
jgi:hypothetical protein